MWPFERQPAADRQHAELAEHRQRLQRRRVAGVEAGRAHPRLVQLVGPVDQAVELALLLGERLHDAHAGDGLVDHAGHGARQPLVVPAGREHPVAEPDRHEGEERDEHHDDEAQQRRQEEHHDDGHDEQRHVGHEHRHREEELLDQREVGGRARHHVADRQLVVAGEVELVEVAVDGQAEVVLEVDAHLGAEVPAGVVGA